jgi:hypothetical protein
LPVELEVGVNGEHVVGVLDASVRDVAVGDLLSGCGSEKIRNEETLKIEFSVELHKIAL